MVEICRLLHFVIHKPNSIKNSTRQWQDKQTHIHCTNTNGTGFCTFSSIRWKCAGAFFTLFIYGFSDTILLHFTILSCKLYFLFSRRCWNCSSWNCTEFIAFTYHFYHFPLALYLFYSVLCVCASNEHQRTICRLANIHGRHGKLVVRSLYNLKSILYNKRATFNVIFMQFRVRLVMKYDAK